VLPQPIGLFQPGRFPWRYEPDRGSQVCQFGSVVSCDLQQDVPERFTSGLQACWLGRIDPPVEHNRRSGHAAESLNKVTERKSLQTSPHRGLEVG
jgi:hypothetical protein